MPKHSVHYTDYDQYFAII